MVFVAPEMRYRIAAAMIVGGIAAATIGDIQRQWFIRNWMARYPGFAPPAMTMVATRAGLILAVTGAVWVFLNYARSSQRSMRPIALWLMLLAYSGYLAARSLELQDLRSVTGYSTFAPGFALATLLLFSGADPSVWRLLVRAIAPATILGGCYVLLQFLLMPSAGRVEAYSRLFTCASILEIGALLPIALYARAHAAVRLLAWIPFLALLAAAVAMQARLMVLETISLAVFFLAIRQHEAGAKRSVKALVALAAAAVFLLCLSIAAGSASTVADSARGLWERRAEDTRSGQAMAFFDKVSPDELILGNGIPKLGDYNAQGVSGIDCGYINILFVAGVPGLVLFLTLHILPAAKCVALRLNPVDAACAASVLTYAVRLFSSTVPTLDPNYLVLLLLMGRCTAVAATSRERSPQFRRLMVCESFGSRTA